MTTERFLKKGVDLLRKSENAARQLLADAVAVGNYEAVERLTSLAVALNRLAAGLPASISTSFLRESASPVPKPHEAKREAGDGRRKSSDYPRFLRRGNYLVKIGWSKRKRKAYQHRLPHEFIDAVVEGVRDAGSDGKVFTTEQLLPVKDIRDGTVVPDYQAYVALAWLRQLGLVERHGRQGYSIPHEPDFVERVADAWQRLPTH